MWTIARAPVFCGMVFAGMLLASAPAFAQSAGQSNISQPDSGLDQQTDTSRDFQADIPGQPAADPDKTKLHCKSDSDTTIKEKDNDHACKKKDAPQPPSP